MARKIDTIKDRLVARGKEARDFASEWILQKQEQYEESEGSMVVKGKLAGLSPQKHYAALFMILHPSIFALKDIAGIVETSVGVLRVWRTQEAFQRVMNEVSVEFGGKLAETVAGHTLRMAGMDISHLNLNMWEITDSLSISDIKIDDVETLIHSIFVYVPFYSKTVKMHFFSRLVELLKDRAPLNFMTSLMILAEAMLVKDEKSKREWGKSTLYIDFVKIMSSICIDLLSQDHLTGEERINVAKTLTALINYILHR